MPFDYEVYLYQFGDSPGVTLTIVQADEMRVEGDQITFYVASELVAAFSSRQVFVAKPGTLQPVAP